MTTKILDYGIKVDNVQPNLDNTMDEINDWVSESVGTTPPPGFDSYTLSSWITLQDIAVGGAWGTQRVVKYQSTSSGYNAHSTVNNIPSGYQSAGFIEVNVRPTQTNKRVYILVGSAPSCGLVFMITGDIHIYTSGGTTQIISSYSANTNYHIRIEWFADYTFLVWVDGVLYDNSGSRWDFYSAVSPIIIKFQGIDEYGLFYMWGYGNIWDGYQPFTSLGKTFIFAQSFVEYSAKVRDIATQEILSIDFSKLNKSEYPSQVKSWFDGLSINKQIRWLQLCVKENNIYYLVLLDGLMEQLIKDEIRIKNLEET